MIVFELDRVVDRSGVAGTGRVAQGVVFDSGWCALTWFGTHQSVAFYPSIETLYAIHGHNGDTLIRLTESAKQKFEPVVWPCCIRQRLETGDYSGCPSAPAHIQMKQAAQS